MLSIRVTVHVVNGMHEPFTIWNSDCISSAPTNCTPLHCAPRDHTATMRTEGSHRYTAQRGIAVHHSVAANGKKASSTTDKYKKTCEHFLLAKLVKFYVLWLSKHENVEIELRDLQI